MDGGHVIPEEIRGLLEQRSTYQGWLGRLDELGAEYRPEVADKVRADYSSRLSEVEAKLEGHRSELETALGERTEAVERVSGEHDARTAELEETQLRHVVGEFDDAEWEARRAEHQGLIDELEAELASERSAVESLQAVLGEFAGSAAAAAAAGAEAEPEALAVEHDEWTDPATVEEEPAEAPEPEVGAEEPEAESDDWMTQPLEGVESDDSAAAEGGEAVKAVLVDPDVVESEFADTDFVEAVVVDKEEAEAPATPEAAEPEAAEPMAAEPEADEPAAEPDAEPDEFMDELEFLESLSLDDADSFDAVSAMLDEDESGREGDSKRKPEDH